MDDIHFNGFVNGDDLPEFRAMKLPQVQDAFARIEALVDHVDQIDFEGEPETGSNPAVQRLIATLRYEDGRLPAPRQFIVWVDDFELDLTLVAEMPL